MLANPRRRCIEGRVKVSVHAIQDLTVVPQNFSFASANCERVALKEGAPYGHCLEEGVRVVLAQVESALNPNMTILNKPHISSSHIREVHVVKAVHMRVAPKCTVLAHALRRSHGRRLWLFLALGAWLGL